MKQFIALGPRRDLARPAKDGGNPDAALVEVRFLATIGCVPSRAVRATVVVQKHDQGVVEHVLGVERVQDLADRIVHGLELPALLGVRRITVEIDVFLRRVVRVVYGVERQIQEKGATAVVPLDQPGRLVGQEKGRVAGLDHGTSIPVPVQNPAAIPAAMKRERIDFPRIVPIVMLESALQGKVLRLPLPQVPLPDDPGRIAGVAQGLGDRALVGQHAVVIAKPNAVLRAVLPVITAGE